MGRGIRIGQWWRVTLLAACVGVAAIVIPPLVVPKHGHTPSAQPAPSAPRSAAPPPSASPAPSPTSPSPSGFTPIGVQAEDPGNLLTAPAEVVACATCQGGQRVRYLGGRGQVLVRATLPVAGSRTVTIVYESDGSRTCKISVNGAPPLVRSVSGPDWKTPQTLRFTTVLPAGVMLLAFYNDAGPAPDLDAVLIA